MEVQQAEKEIAYIKTLMDDSRRSLAESGVGYIIWGILIVMGILFNYVRLLDLTEINPLYVWIAVIGTGWIYTFFCTKKDKAENAGTTIARKVLGAVWISAGISMTLIGFLATTTGTIGGYAILPLMSTVLGMAFFVSGTVYSEKWIKFIGLGWWSTAVLFFLWKNIHSLLIFAILMVIFQILPGIYFYRKWKNEYSGANSKQEHVQ